MIPLVDLKAQYRQIKDEVRAAIDGVLESGQFVLGEEVAAFEREFAAFSGTRHAVAVNSGTSALHLALLAAGVGSGDEVITVTFTFVATAAAIAYTGARPVFVEIEPRSLTIDPARIEAAITPRTRAIVPVHLYGQPADMDPILEIARRRSLLVIEDAAQAHGAEYKGRRAGSMGDLACFSFYPSKNLGAYGEGGLVTTDNPEYARSIQLLRNWGEEARYHHVVQAYNYRMEGFQGAILRVKLRHLEAWTEARRQNAQHYNRLFADADVRIPETRSDSRHVYYVYAVQVRDRDGLKAALDTQAIHTGTHYPIPVHLQKAYAHLGYSSGDFPHSEAAAAEVLSLPMYPELTLSQIETVVSAVKRYEGQQS
jgi:dTDP-4-amino-4,6-dideoxygalactose transaminase